jgi:cytoskeletal protein CcmA (bactofilin family)
LGNNRPGMFFKRKKSKMQFAESPRQQSSEATFISRDMTVEGNLMCEGELHIDGSINGSVKAHVCLVDSNAQVTGSITADTLYIYGQVNGPVDAANVHIYASANVRGDVTNESISIENGAVIHGSIRNGRSSVAFAPQISTSTLFNQLDQQSSDDYRPVKVVKPRG